MNRHTTRPSRTASTPAAIRSTPSTGSPEFGCTSPDSGCAATGVADGTDVGAALGLGETSGLGEPGVGEPTVP